jgi:ribosome biogenesis protein BMS1
LWLSASVLTSPQAFTVKNASRMAKMVRHKADMAHKKAHVPIVSHQGEVPAPDMVVVAGPPQTGKTTLIQNLVRHYSKRKLSQTTGPITVVAGKHKRLTFFECPNLLSSMIDLAKVADLVILTIDAAQGLEMETFEFLNLLQVHGFTKVLTVVTNLDKLGVKRARKTRTAIKNRVWKEIAPGAKVIGLSGIERGQYPRAEIHNMARFIAQSKPRPLLWRNSHPAVVADRVEDVTDPALVEADRAVDRTVAMFGYVRGTYLRPDTTVHIPGVGDFVPASIEALPDPCPPADPNKKMLSDKARLLYAPYADAGAVTYDRDAVYVAVPTRAAAAEDLEAAADMAVATQALFAGDAAEAHSRAADHAADDALFSLFAGDAADAGLLGAATAEDDADLEGSGSVEFSEGGFDDAAADEESSSSSSGLGLTGSDDDGPGLAELDAGFDAAQAVRARRVARFAPLPSDEAKALHGAAKHGEDVSRNAWLAGSAGAEELEDQSDDIGFADERSEHDLLLPGDGTEMLFEEELSLADSDIDAENESSATSEAVPIGDIGSRVPIDWHTLVYGPAAVSPYADVAASSGAESAAGASGQSELDDLFSLVSKPAVLLPEDLPLNFSLPRELVPILTVLALDAADARAQARSAKFRSAGGAVTADHPPLPVPSDDVISRMFVRGAYGELEESDSDSESGSGASSGDGDGDGANDADADGAPRANKAKGRIELANEEDDPDLQIDGSHLEALQKEAEETMARNAAFAAGAHTPGTYVRFLLEGVPAEFVEYFDPVHPVLLGGVQPAEGGQGFIHARVKRHRWFVKILKNRNPLVWSIGWRRFQSLPVYSLRDPNGRERMLKYTPEHMHCNATFYGPSAPPQTGIAAFATIGNGQASFRVAMTGVTLEMQTQPAVVKKLKLIGYPRKVARTSAIVKGMFSSSREVARFTGARLKTVAGLRGEVKKALRTPEGDFRATFEDKIQFSDTIILKTWSQVLIDRFFLDTLTLCVPSSQRSDYGVAGSGTGVSVRSVAQLRAARELAVPVNRDSLYLPITERSGYRAAPLRVPMNLQRRLPASSKQHVVKKRAEPSYLQRRAVKRPAAERKADAILQAASTVLSDHTEKRAAASDARKLKKAREETVAMRKRGEAAKRHREETYRSIGIAQEKAAKRANGRQR